MIGVFLMVGCTTGGFTTPARTSGRCPHSLRMSSGSGPRAHFLFVVLVMRHTADSLTDLMRDTVQAMGYELVGVEYHGRDKGGGLLRIYIDNPDGITVDDCADVSHQLAGVLDVENPIEGNYDLEVSSPGLDRPLFEKVHFERFAGSQVKLKLHTKIDGRRRFEGLLKGTRGDQVVLEIEGGEFVFPLQQIETARLVPEL